MKNDFFKYIGAEDSLAGYSRSYKLVLYKVFFTLMDGNGIASGYKIAEAFRNFYADSGIVKKTAHPTCPVMPPVLVLTATVSA